MFDLRAAYWLAIITSLAAAATSAAAPRPCPSTDTTTAAEPTSMASVLRAHTRTLLTVGIGAAALMLVRATRDALLPLWAAEIGLGPAETSLIFAASSAIDLMLFYIGGSMMDRYGRRSVAVPTMLIMGACFGLLPLTATAAGLTADRARPGRRQRHQLGRRPHPGVGRLPRGRPPPVPRGVATPSPAAIGQAAGPLLISGWPPWRPCRRGLVPVGAIGLLGGGLAVALGRPGRRGADVGGEAAA